MTEVALSLRYTARRTQTPGRKLFLSLEDRSVEAEVPTHLGQAPLGVTQSSWLYVAGIWGHVAWGDEKEGEQN